MQPENARRLRWWRGVVALAVAAVGVGLAHAPAAHAATPVAWCGNPGVTSNLPDMAATHLVHPIYAVPSDGTSRVATLPGPIATDLAAVDTWWRGQDATRSVRFDLFPFAGCEPGLGQLDLSSVVMPKAGSAYSANPYSTVSADLRELGFDDPAKKYLVYYDGPTSSVNVCGTGGGMFAFVWLARCPQDLGAGEHKAATAAHELAHAFGAVAGAAPNECATPHSGHVCDSTNDLMYWAVPDLSEALLDLGRDDYYDHPGSWLDVRDSPWLEQAGVSQVELAVSVEGNGRVDSSPAGIADCRSACSFSYNRGTQVTLQASPGSGMRIRGWQGACSGISRSCVLDLAAAASARVVFAPPNVRPTASFDAGPRYSLNQRITFVSTSRDPDGAIRNAQWSFGDGTEATGDRVTHAYTRPGFFRITLTVTDDEGATARKIRLVRVVDNRPTALAHARTTRPGKRVRLPYRLQDDVRVERARIEIRVGLKMVRYERAIKARSWSGYVTWRAPKERATYQWCVRAWDSRGQMSARSCAAVRVR